jgi:hypothetical protein
MLVSVIIVTVFDIIFAFTEMGVWNNTDETNPMWETIRPMHRFSIFCLIVINMLKILLIIFLGKGISEMSKPVQAR